MADNNIVERTEEEEQKNTKNDEKKKTMVLYPSDKQHIIEWVQSAVLASEKKKLSETYVIPLRQAMKVLRLSQKNVTVRDIQQCLAVREDYGEKFDAKAKCKTIHMTVDGFMTLAFWLYSRKRYERGLQVFELTRQIQNYYSDVVSIASRTTQIARIEQLQFELPLIIATVLRLKDEHAQKQTQFDAHDVLNALKLSSK